MANGNPNKDKPKKDKPKKDKPKKEAKTYELRIYTTTSVYAGDLELLATIRADYKDITAERGRIISQAKGDADEFAKNVGLFGITIENPKDTFSFYPPHRIFKVEYNEVDDD